MSEPKSEAFLKRLVDKDDRKLGIRLGQSSTSDDIKILIDASLGNKDESPKIVLSQEQIKNEAEKKAKETILEWKQRSQNETDRLSEAMPLPTPEMLVQPRFWGRAEWGALLAEAYAFPKKPTEEQIDAACQRVGCLKIMLPCHKCRDHWTKQLEDHPLRPVLESEGGPGFRKWVVDRHNSVNKSNGKKEMAFGHVCEKYVTDGNLYRIATIVLAVSAGVLAILLVFVAAKLSAYVSRYGCGKQPKYVTSNS